MGDPASVTPSSRRAPCGKGARPRASRVLESGIEREAQVAGRVLVEDRPRERRYRAGGRMRGVHVLRIEVRGDRRRAGELVGEHHAVEYRTPRRTLLPAPAMGV